MRQLLVLICLTSTLFAAPRLWKEADGGRTVQGDFVSRDAAGVTIRRSDQRTVTIPLARLHADDIAWLDKNHPLPKPPPPPLVAVLDTLRFGDTRAEVLEKLKASEFVELTVNEVYLARVGLNGVFRTREKIGGLSCSLSFDWAEDDTLSEITLDSIDSADQTDPKRIRGCWDEVVKLLTKQHGEPIQHTAYPDPAKLDPGTFLASHLWRLKDGGTILLGSSHGESGFSTTVRITSATLEPNRVP